MHASHCYGTFQIISKNDVMLFCAFQQVPTHPPFRPRNTWGPESQASNSLPLNKPLQGFEPGPHSGKRSNHRCTGIPAYNDLLKFSYFSYHFANIIKN